MAFGFWELFTGLIISGLWMIFIGWFLAGAARSSYEQLLLRRALEGVRVNEVMTSRPDIVAMECDMGLTMVREVFQKTGHSRIPVFEGSLDHIVGVLYARDLLHYVGERAEAFDVRKAVRPAFFVPETKPLRDLLGDFRSLKIHMAIVLDEYGGTAGLVTIEDVLEQLVGDISDEHEPQHPAMLRKIDEKTWDVDARIGIEELNSLLPVSLPDDPNVQTLGGYVATAIGRIPETGAVLTIPGARITVTDAEPQKINRVRIVLQDGPAKATDIQ
jgi:putative hemolysin